MSRLLKSFFVALFCVFLFAAIVAAPPILHYIFGGNLVLICLLWLCFLVFLAAWGLVWDSMGFMKGKMR
jgi:hypothetical protein